MFLAWLINNLFMANGKCQGCSVQQGVGVMVHINLYYVPQQAAF